MKISVLYVSQTGNTAAAAEFIEDGILAAHPFVQVKLMDIRENEVDEAFLRDSAAVIFGSPVYFAGMNWELKKWFDHSFRLNLSGKLGAAFVTAQSPSGGTDTALLDMLRHMMLKGMLVFSGQGSGGAHRFQLGAVGVARSLQQDAEQFEAFGEAVAQTAVKLFGK